MSYYFEAAVVSAEQDALINLLEKQPQPESLNPVLAENRTFRLLGGRGKLVYPGMRPVGAERLAQAERSPGSTSLPLPP